MAAAAVLWMAAVAVATEVAALDAITAPGGLGPTVGPERSFHFLTQATLL